ncbi:hypothetical protein ASZ90_015081 [hydrocarbon metagenome]|uniref:Uncharacterized protein n=1 Tax=hydrocarbon metagenome TaxID=938273 RepID=A0A0W8F341_9ZZZZ
MMGVLSVLQRWLAGVKEWISARLPGRNETTDLENALDQLACSREYLLNGDRDVLVSPSMETRGELPGVARVTLSRADREMVESLLVLHQELGDIAFGTDKGLRSRKMQ